MCDEAWSHDDYLERWEEARRVSGESHRRLERADFERLAHEYDRLLARMDPGDIQLDEWKRLEELRFLLILEEDDEDD